MAATALILPQTLAVPRRHRAHTRQRQMGVSLLEVALSLTIMAIMAAELITMQARAAAQTKENVAADRMAAIVQAASTYISQNFQLMSQTPANGGAYTAGGLIIPIYNASGAAPAGLSTLQASGLLPAGQTPTNPYGQTEWLLVKQQSASPLVMNFLLVTTGGQAITAADLPYVASKIGAGGGFISTAAPYSASTIQGAYGGWSYPVANWNIGAIRPAPGHIAAVLAYGVTPVAQYLYRVAVPFHPEANQMSTDLDMNNNNITNIATASAVTLSASGAIVDNGTLTVSGAAGFGSDVNVAGNLTSQHTITAQDFLAHGTVTANNVVANTADITGNAVIHGNLVVLGTITGGDVNSNGDVSAVGNVKATNVTASGTVNASAVLASDGDFSNSVSATNTMTTGAVYSSGLAVSTAYGNGSGNAGFGGNVWISGNLGADGNLDIWGNAGAGSFTTNGTILENGYEILNNIQSAQGAASAANSAAYTAQNSADSAMSRANQACSLAGC